RKTRLWRIPITGSSDSGFGFQNNDSSSFCRSVARPFFSALRCLERVHCWAIVPSESTKELVRRPREVESVSVAGERYPVPRHSDSSEPHDDVFFDALGPSTPEGRSHRLPEIGN